MDDDATDAAASNEAAAASTPDDGARPPPVDEEDDSDADLRDVAFPIVDERSASGDGAGDGPPLPPTGGGAGDGKGDTHSGAATMHKVDEEAIVRCLGLSVDAHITGGEVKAFEPMPSTSGVGTAANMAGGEGTTGQRRAEWFPASLPLPSWAKNIP